MQRLDPHQPNHHDDLMWIKALHRRDSDKQRVKGPVPFRDPVQTADELPGQ
jgi:hypothetical protein